MKLSSKRIANEFDLHHRSVLRSIRRLQNIEALKEQFEETSFKHKGGTYPAYLVSEVGFAILMHRFKVDDFKKVNYYLQRYAEERIKKREIESNEIKNLVNTIHSLENENFNLAAKSYKQKNRSLWQRLFKKELA